MFFLQSLFCWVGADNRYRFSLIVAFNHLFFIVFSAVFHTSFFLSCIILMLSTIILTCTTKRRLNDARLTKNWLYTPAISFAIIGLIIISFNYQPLYWLTLFPAALSSILLTYPSQNNSQYNYGYSGPINLSPVKNTTIRNQRIEPTLTSQHVHLNVENTTSFNHPPTQSFEDSYYKDKASANNAAQDIGELIREKLLNNHNSKFVILGLLTIIVIAMLTSLILSFSSKNQETTKTGQESLVEEKSTQTTINERTNKVTLPDDFSIMTTPFNGLIVHWQADSTHELNLWDISRATGDDSCKSISFNNDNSYRTTKVYVENTDEYIAEFSPLDTRKILKDIALRSNFTLCGYSFSLKGSQATLGKSNFYADLLAQ
ncbi:hypothetical protein [Thalassotalea castellviae]|uniref:DUF805 domain-containing protein n=1 Tax=Thalassotalea castellviae TaxID=3075612 RepID=A0ABU3A3X7_9GAMM|nr:hypothetical protein [Thalassotalea sp. W431]MDT0604882.1 hypothetical protein [Thalassotalea sp. W431]